MQLLDSFQSARKAKISDEHYYHGFDYVVKLRNWLKTEKGVADIPIANTTKQIFVEFYEHQSRCKVHNRQNISNNTLKHIMVYFQLAFKWAMEQEYVETNPLASIRKPKIDHKEARYLSTEDYYKFINQADTEPLVQLLKIMLVYGLRRSELLGLNFGSIDFSSKTIRICKKVLRNKDNCLIISDKMKTATSNRTLPLNDFIVNILHSMKNRRKSGL
jgi:integrase